MKRKLEEACATCGHFHDYERGEPCGVCGHTLAVAPAASTPAHPPVAPAAARPGRVAHRLWFGSYEVGARPNLLASLGVTAVVSLVPGGGALYPHSLTYTVLDPNEPDLAAAVRAIDEAIAAGGSAFIMCMTGVSRSPAVAAAWLVAKGLAPDAASAVAACAAARPGVALTAPDAARLASFAAAVAAAPAAPASGGSGGGGGQ